MLTEKVGTSGESIHGAQRAHDARTEVNQKQCNEIKQQGYSSHYPKQR